MIYRAIQLIQAGGRTDEGNPRGPRGPKNISCSTGVRTVHVAHRFPHWCFKQCNSSTVATRTGKTNMVSTAVLWQVSVILLHKTNSNGIFTVLSQIWKCRKSLNFGANYLGPKYCWFYIVSFSQVWAWWVWLGENDIGTLKFKIGDRRQTVQYWRDSSGWKQMLLNLGKL